MADEDTGLGTTLKYSTDGGSVYETLLRLTSIGKFNFGEVNIIKFLCYDAADGFVEKIAGAMDAGAVDFTGIWNDDASQAGLDALRGIKYDYKITLPGTLGELVFEAILSGPEIDPPVDAEITYAGTLEISGKPVFT